MTPSQVRLGSIQAVRFRSPLVLAQTAATLDELRGAGSWLRRACSRDGARRGTASGQAHPAKRSPSTSRRYGFSSAASRWPFRATTSRWNRPGSTGGLYGLGFPVWIAANSPGGLAAAARLGDGVPLEGASSPEYTANAVGNIWESARAAARPARLSRRPTRQRLARRHWDAALQSVRPSIAHRFRAEQPGAARIAIGEPHVTPEDLARLVASYQGRVTEALEAAMPASSVAPVPASGTEADVQSRVAEYRAAGLDVPLLWPARGTSIVAVLAAFGRPNEQEVMQ